MSLEQGLGLALVVVAAAVIMVMGFFVLRIGYRLVKTYPIVVDPEAPRSLKVVFWLAILYTVSPLDILPDPVFVDDLLALVGALSHISNKGSELGLGGTDRDAS